MGGRQKNSGGHTPIEASESGRSKQRVRIVEVISEGEILGLANGMRSIRFDNTPLQTPNGDYTFSNVEVDGRVGSQTQGPMFGFQGVEKEVSVATEIKKQVALTRTITDANVSSLRLTLTVQSRFVMNVQGVNNPTRVVL